MHATLLARRHDGRWCWGGRRSRRRLQERIQPCLLRRSFLVVGHVHQRWGWLVGCGGKGRSIAFPLLRRRDRHTLCSSMMACE